MIRIGERELAVSRPADLDGALIAATGCHAAELHGLLAGAQLASLVACTLSPFLGEGAPSIAELATEIAEAGTAEVAEAVRALLLPDESASDLAEVEDPPARGRGRAGGAS